MKHTLAAAAILATLAGPAMAQTTAPQATNQREQLTRTLQSAGFTDVKVMPDSYLVQAKDKDGNPVNMFISPNSVTEVMGAPATGMPHVAPGSGGVVVNNGTFISVPGTDKISSNVVGLDVYNADNKDIGVIKDLVFDGGRLRAYIVGVGGFIGMGEHYVAVNPTAVNVTFDHAGNKWHATMNTTADQLKAAPEFKYPPRG